MTKYVFVLTSSPKDFYCEQTLVAVASLRVHNPGAFVTLLTDDRTLATLTGNRAALKDAVDEIKALTLDEKLTPMLRSRFLKTSIRNVIDGDFLFLDSDIAVAHNTSSIYHETYLHCTLLQEKPYHYHTIGSMNRAKHHFYNVLFLLRLHKHYTTQRHLHIDHSQHNISIGYCHSHTI